MGKFSLFSPPLGAYGGPPTGDTAAVELDGADHEAYASVQSDPNASFCSQYYYAPGYATFVGQSCQNSIFGDVWYHIKRTSLAFETSLLAGLTPTAAILRLQPWLTYYTRNYATRIDVVLAPGTHRPAIPSDYGVIGGDNTVIGFLDVPFPAGLTDEYHDIAIPLIDLDPAGYSLWALRSHDDVTATPPPGCSGVGPIGYNNMVGIRGADGNEFSPAFVPTFFTSMPQTLAVVQSGANVHLTGRIHDPTPFPLASGGQPPRLDITVAEAVNGSNLDIRFYHYTNTHPVPVFTPWQMNVPLDTDLSAVVTPIAGWGFFAAAIEMRIHHDNTLLCDGPEITILPVPVPVVETDPATVSYSGATFNGTLSDDGGVPCDCGFEWGTDPSLGNTTGTTSQIIGDTFSQSFTGFTLGPTYYFRAFAINPTGTGYGAILSFNMAKRNQAYPLGRYQI